MLFFSFSDFYLPLFRFLVKECLFSFFLSVVVRNSVLSFLIPLVAFFFWYHYPKYHFYRLLLCVFVSRFVSLLSLLLDFILTTFPAFCFSPLLCSVPTAATPRSDDPPPLASSLGTSVCIGCVGLFFCFESFDMSVCAKRRRGKENQKRAGTLALLPPLIFTFLLFFLIATHGASSGAVRCYLNWQQYTARLFLFFWLCTLLFAFLCSRAVCVCALLCAVVSLFVSLCCSLSFVHRVIFVSSCPPLCFQLHFFPFLLIFRFFCMLPSFFGVCRWRGRFHCFLLLYIPSAALIPSSVLGDSVFCCVRT